MVERQNLEKPFVNRVSRRHPHRPKKLDNLRAAGAPGEPANMAGPPVEGRAPTLKQDPTTLSGGPPHPPVYWPSGFGGIHMSRAPRTSTTSPDTVREFLARLCKERRTSQDQLASESGVALDRVS